ncbi:MAG: biotin synthase BioB [Spirochaetota bacterium]|nr:biotin synthase BioB [Spirochaetota bacterium]
MLSVLSKLTEKVLKGDDLSFEEVAPLVEITKQCDIVTLINFANIIRDEFKGANIETCAIMNAKSGRCSEDCVFCSQSAHHHTQIDRYPLSNIEDIIEKAKEAKAFGADRFSVVTSGRDIHGKTDLESICKAIEDISQTIEIGRCASLGTLTKDSARSLRMAGLERYHHNLETSRSFFPKICSTHSFEDRVDTIGIAKEAGFSVCAGGIFGLGESPLQRIEMAFDLKELDVDSIPLNFLNPIPGTPLEDSIPIPPMEILKTLAIYRFIHPQMDIRVCGGRYKNLRGIQALMYLAGINAVMIGNYLTTPGCDPAEDLQLIKDLMLTPRKSGKHLTE